MKIKLKKMILKISIIFIILAY